MQDSDTFTLSTGYGAYDPLLWVVVLLVALLLAWFLRSFGRADFTVTGDKAKPFLSGNEEPEKDAVHIRASNLYWGFTEALDGYYKRLVPLHSALMTDYILWLLGSLAVLLLLVLT